MESTGKREKNEEMKSIFQSTTFQNICQSEAILKFWSLSVTFIQIT